MTLECGVSVVRGGDVCDCAVLGEAALVLNAWINTGEYVSESGDEYCSGEEEEAEAYGLENWFVYEVADEYAEQSCSEEECV